MNARLETIWLKRAHRGPMDEVHEATVVAGKGLVGDVTTSRRRQVTIIEREVWDSLMRQLGADKSPVGRRANLLISGVSLQDTRGQTLVIGGLRFLIGGHTTPCERMDEYLPGLRAAMQPNWGGGVFAQALDDGVITVGAAVTLESAAQLRLAGLG
jgi:MOSC domain-containing protein YiiM